MDMIIHTTGKISSKVAENNKNKELQPCIGQGTNQ